MKVKAFISSREAYNRLERLGMLWSLGKDSNVMLWLCRKAFFGHMPFPVVHVDTEKKFAEMYALRDRYAKEWGLNLIVGGCPPLEETDATLPPAARAAARKTAGLKSLLAREGLYRRVCRHPPRRGRHARQGTRVQPARRSGAMAFPRSAAGILGSIQDGFSAGNPYSHSIRLLHWSEIDVWLCTERENIPTVPLYFSKRDGKRYRSLGDEDITSPIDSEAVTIEEIIAELRVTTAAERAGRAMDHEAEDSFERLRADGYM